MGIDQLAEIVLTGEVPLGLKGNEDNAAGIRAALNARRLGLYEGMTLEQIKEKMRSNRETAA